MLFWFGSPWSSSAFPSLRNLGKASEPFPRIWDGKNRGAGLNFLAWSKRRREEPGSGIVSTSREEGAGSNSEPQPSSGGPKIPAGIPELVSRSFSGGCNGKQQPWISGCGHVSSGLGQSRGSHELLLWQIPAPRGTRAWQFPWKQEQSTWNARGEVDAGMERG